MIQIVPKHPNNRLKNIYITKTLYNSMDDDKKFLYIVITAAIGSFTMSYAANGLSVVLPTLASVFHISNIMENWIVYTYLIILSIAGVPLAKICGKHGLKKSFEMGLVIFTIGSLIACFSVNIYMILLARVVQGIGATMTFVTNVAIITAEIPAEKRGHALGINVTGVYTGITISPTISGILVHNLSWRFVFLITIPTALIALYLLRKIDKEWIMEKGDLDKTGSLIYVIGIGFLLYGFTELNSLWGVMLAAIGALLLIIFAKYELKQENPVYEMRLFKNINYTTANLVALIAYLSTYVVTYVLNYHFQYILGYDPQTAGFILISTPIMMLLVAGQAGKLSDRIQPEILQLLGVSIVTIALGMLSMIDSSTPLHMVVIAMVLQGIGHGFFSSPNNNIILSSVDNKKDIPTASASVATVRNLGQAFSLGILTVCFAFIMGNVPIQASNYHLLLISNHMTLTITTLLCSVAVILSIIGLRNSMKAKKIKNFSK